MEHALSSSLLSNAKAAAGAGVVTATAEAAEAAEAAGVVSTKAAEIGGGTGGSRRRQTCMVPMVTAHNTSSLRGMLCTINQNTRFIKTSYLAAVCVHV